MPKSSSQETAVVKDNSYLPPNSQSFFTVQVLKGDRRLIAPYEGRDYVPYCLTRRLTEDDCKKFLDSDTLVTFTARMPLETVTQGVAEIRSHLEERAFDFPVSLDSCEFRPVGACLEDFDCELAGDVLLQVTCAISRG